MNTMKNETRSRNLLIASMVIFGTLGPLVRQINVTSGELAFYRATLATILISSYLLLSKQKIPFSQIKKEIPLLLFSGAAMGFNWILLFEAYKYTTVSVATLSYYFAPVIVTLVCPVLFKEKMKAKQWLCFIASTLGIILITGIGELNNHSSHFIGILYGLGAACLYATVILINKFIKNVEGIHRTLLQFIAAVLVLGIYVSFTSGITLQNCSSLGIVCLLIVGIVHTGITYCMYFTSLKDIPGQKAAILSYIDPLVAVLVSVVFLKEALTLFQCLGGALILGFTLYNELN